MAITDHDSVDGYLAVRDHWHGEPMRLVAGVELSCIWQKRLIHVVALDIDIDNPVLKKGLEQQQYVRLERAKRIDAKLLKLGFEGGLKYATDLAGGNEIGRNQIGRPHFARFLVDRGHVSSENEAFNRYLGSGKLGDIKQLWPELESVMAWIHAAGGVAVLAHPLHYKMTATKLRALCEEFKSFGGHAIEVISGKQPKDKVQYIAQLAERYDLHASIGSDFHKPDTPWRELGKVGSLPKNCQPVWELFSENSQAANITK